MRPPPRSLEEMLYRMLMDSPSFHRFVRRIHAKINRIPLHENGPHTTINVDEYNPSIKHKTNSFFLIWKDEFKNTFGIGKRK
ncbi:Piso0_005197 [Millerozyma farinosa CBS 7064]|uniref:Piso0_005197 protein n=1 Tax=Pichia sorbitophila (strain ATCC MYA-4447 / BCRC 22081 / CBS 7064 / NBRC 10061 / NRRL Y-12695) TaxID=559304 RepID=G8Y4G7_PICSO|nr:Piso0_005197 [Millerozyma farinosa CBS 7064]